MKEQRVYGLTNGLKMQNQSRFILETIHTPLME
jgi:hypothetical protein